MNSQKELFSHAATVLAVANVGHSLAYYQNKLGFTCNFKWNDPMDYAVLKRGDISIHLTNKDNAESVLKNQISIYIFVHDVDVVYHEFSEKNVTHTHSYRRSRIPNAGVRCYRSGRIYYWFRNEY